MKKRWILAIGALVLAGVAFAAGAARPPDLADFEMTVGWTGSELALECFRGCAWKELTVGFGGESGEFRLDEFGMVDSSEAE